MPVRTRACDISRPHYNKKSQTAAFSSHAAGLRFQLVFRVYLTINPFATRSRSRLPFRAGFDCSARHDQTELFVFVSQRVDFGLELS
jgi:hypothetical protein